MVEEKKQSSVRKAISLLWFPFFFAAAFATLGLFAFAHPAPHGMEVGIVQTDSSPAITGLPDGIVLTPVLSTGTASAAVSSGDLAAAVDGSRLLVSSAASATRADYLSAVFEGVSPGLEVVDVQPLAEGDVSGVGLFFFALPNLLVGLITSIVLLQFPGWRLRAKLTTLAITGAFAAVFSFALASGLSVIPADVRLVGYAFLLTQAIGWLTTAAALHVKHYFMPLSMTFVLILGIPTSGATVNSDMLPTWLAAISDWHPFAQFIVLARADAYLGADIARPLAVIVAWMVLGAVLLTLQYLRDRPGRSAESEHTSVDEAELIPKPAPAMSAS